MLKAKCVKVEYEIGERVVCQGVKGSRAGKHVGGHFFQNAGFGVGQYFIASKLILYVRMRGEKPHPVLIGRFFKNKIGKLTEQRRELIAQTMPETIAVRKGKEEMLSSDPEMSLDDRTTQYRASTKDLRDWFSRISKLMENSKELRKIKQKVKERKEAEKQRIEKLEKEALKEFVREMKRERDAEEARLEKRRRNALKLSFVRGYNPKHETEQWEARHDGRLYVLRREDGYEPEEKEVPVEKMFDLVPDRIVLVQRI